MIQPIPRTRHPQKLFSMSPNAHLTCSLRNHPLICSDNNRPGLSFYFGLPTTSKRVFQREPLNSLDGIMIAPRLRFNTLVFLVGCIFLFNRVSIPESLFTYEKGLPQPHVDAPVRTELITREKTSLGPIIEERPSWPSRSETYDVLARLLSAALNGTEAHMMPCGQRLGDPSLESRYGYLRNKTFNILLGGNTFNTDHILPTQMQAITDLMLFLKSDTITFGASIHESGSTDQTRNILDEALIPMLRHLGVNDSEIFVTTNPVGPDWKMKPDDRIPILADLRNLVISHLKKSSTRFNLLFFFNDVYYCVDDLLELLHQHFHQKADVTCATDYSKPKGFYDWWVARDIEGNALWTIGRSHSFFELHAPSKKRYLQRLPIQMYSCWNGMLIFDAIPFVDNDLVFRDANVTKGECRESESTRICKDFWMVGKGKIQMLPAVAVAYKEDVYLKTKAVNGPEVKVEDKELIEWAGAPKKGVHCVPYKDAKLDYGSKEMKMNHLKK
ncbi:alpha-1,3-mannosyltransferase CMT1 [Planoprotostelium fungivorum]|uniref:Alpha-1,3-mannosyltransferase CMT1 n=1 Tax=Planoprotostelium fungivorum TaxID=1890364 RepID=A0A2P6ND97_9EUKA|nr:alpha-1,3-mannosyltransferase CMT1 [Planoprotostelium fungivorum]